MVLNNMKIGVRLGLSFGLILLILLAISIIATVSLNTVCDDSVLVENESLPHAILADNMTLQTLKVLQLLLYASTTHQPEAYKEAAEVADNFKQNIAKFEEMYKRKGDTESLKKIEELEASFDEYYVQGEDIVFIYFSEGVEEGNKHLPDFDNAAEVLTSKVKELQKGEIDKAEKSVHNMIASASRVRVTVFLLSGLAIALSVLIALFITRSITGSVRRVLTGFKAIEQGDLTIRLEAESKDEMGKLARGFNTFLERFQEIIKNIVANAEILNTSANEISTTVSQLAASATETSSSVSEISTTLEEVKQTSHLSSEKASHVAKSAEKTAQISEQGKKATQDAVAGMNRIKEEMDYIAEGIVQLSAHTQSIGQIIDSVNDLADQSNLLSVNASIEAAKAGEHGKGFAVVAQEVKSLADQSKKATDQVRSILNDIQKASSSAVMATERGSKAVTAGVDLSAQAGDTIGTLANNVTESAQAATQISASSHQQLAGMDQLAQAMESIKDASTQNEEGSKQLETQAQSLKELGYELKELAGKFKV